MATGEVAKSTKVSRDGYIGEKGIGFKAVFTVTDFAHVHSNGFHFYFKHENKSKRGELGLTLAFQSGINER